MDLSLSQFERRLATYRPRVDPRPPLARSAVSVLLRFDSAAPEVLLMKRADRRGDRWSGHVSLPGGRESPGDVDLRATAVRETREEVGLDLTHMARPIGRLDTIRALARGRVQPLTITPFVYVQTGAARIVLNHEAESAFWFPLDRALCGELSDQYAYGLGPVPVDLPCWRYQGYVVWGLTYRMLGHLLDVVTAPDPALQR